MSFSLCFLVLSVFLPFPFIKYCDVWIDFWSSFLKKLKNLSGASLECHDKETKCTVKVCGEKVYEWARKDSNLRPMDYESTALTAELRALTFFN